MGFRRVRAAAPPHPFPSRMLESPSRAGRGAPRSRKHEAFQQPAILMTLAGAILSHLLGIVRGHDPLLCRRLFDHLNIGRIYKVFEDLSLEERVPEPLAALLTL